MENESSLQVIDESNAKTSSTFSRGFTWSIGGIVTFPGVGYYNMAKAVRN